MIGLLDTSGWAAGIRVIVRDEPLHPRYRKRATDREKKLGRRYQLIATNTRIGQVAWLDARHRSHVHVEDDVKQATALGLGPMALPALGDQRRLDPGRGDPREPARLLPPPRPPRGSAARGCPETAAVLLCWTYPPG